MHTHAAHKPSTTGLEWKSFVAMSHIQIHSPSSAYTHTEHTLLVLPNWNTVRFVRYDERRLRLVRTKYSTGLVTFCSWSLASQMRMWACGISICTGNYSSSTVDSLCLSSGLAFYHIAAWFVSKHLKREPTAPNAKSTGDRKVNAQSGPDILIAPNEEKKRERYTSKRWKRVFSARAACVMISWYRAWHIFLNINSKCYKSEAILPVNKHFGRSDTENISCEVWSKKTIFFWNTAHSSSGRCKKNAMWVHWSLLNRSNIVSLHGNSIKASGLFDVICVCLQCECVFVAFFYATHSEYTQVSIFFRFHRKRMINNNTNVDESQSKTYRKKKSFIFSNNRVYPGL